MTHQFSRPRVVAAVASGCACALLSGAAAAAPRFHVLDLGPSSVRGSQALALDGLGAAAGQSSGVAALFTAGQVVTLPGLGGAFSAVNGLNGSGLAAGYADAPDFNGAHHAVTWRDGVLTDLGTLGGQVAWATAVNEAGQVVGESQVGGTVYRAFLFSGGHMKDLGTLPQGTTSAAMAINAKGWIAGYAFVTTDAAFHAFLYSKGHMTDLGTGGQPGSMARAINAKGQVAGSFVGADGVPLAAWIYSKGQYRTLPGPANMEARGLDGTGHVVGSVGPGLGAFYYDGKTTTLVSSRLDAASKGWSVTALWAIDDQGRMAGEAVSPADGMTHAVRVTLVAR